MSLKIVLVLMAMSFSCPAFSHEDPSEAPASETLSKGVKSHNGKKQDLTPEEIAQKKADREALKAARANFKKDGKFSKEDRKKLRAMKKEARKKIHGATSEGSNSSISTGKNTQQMIDDADSEPETEQEDAADPQMPAAEE